MQNVGERLHGCVYIPKLNSDVSEISASEIRDPEKTGRDLRSDFGISDLTLHFFMNKYGI